MLELLSIFYVLRHKSACKALDDAQYSQSRHPIRIPSTQAFSDVYSNTASSIYRDYKVDVTLIHSSTNQDTDTRRDIVV